MAQPAEDVYKPATCEELLKWKFPWMNSVDFLLKRTKAYGANQNLIVRVFPMPVVAICETFVLSAQFRSDSAASVSACLWSVQPQKLPDHRRDRLPTDMFTIIRDRVLRPNYATVTS